MKAATTWTRPYYGITHLESADRRYRATVSDRRTFVTLSLWFPGCGFSPEQRTASSVAEAKSEGELWLAAVEMRRMPQAADHGAR